MAQATRMAAWGSTVPADGWSRAMVLYAAAIHRMREKSPRLDELGQVAQRYRSRQHLELDEPGQSIAVEIIEKWGDPTGLGYQAQVHATFMPDVGWPKVNGTKVPWNKCTHDNWWFLPWHRAYLLEFETVARQHLVDAGVPQAEASAWALPYWNSSDYVEIPAAAGLPMAVRSATLPDDLEVPGIDPGTDRRNPLFDPHRRMTADPVFDPAAPFLVVDPGKAHFADASMALARRHFGLRNDGNLVSFGGGYLEDMDLSHGGAGEPGQLDQQPHGLVHVMVGGNMGRFETAGLDPLFWMHHCNIDRLWETYAHELDHGYPFQGGTPTGDAQESWKGERFMFLRGDGTPVEWSAPQLTDVEQLGYQYESRKAPTTFPVDTDPDDPDNEPFGFSTRVPVPISAASRVEVTRSRTVTLTGGEPGEDGTTIGTGQRWTLRFVGVTTNAPAVTGYVVQLGPEGREETVGTLSLFGAFEASVSGSTGSGVTRVLEVTETVARLRAGPGGFDVFQARVVLLPMTDDDELDAVGLLIGSAALYVA